ncbi:hypothetical protein ACP4OV_028120 [Aristida adscensionis]
MVLLGGGRRPLGVPTCPAMGGEFRGSDARGREGRWDGPVRRAQAAFLGGARGGWQPCSG